MPDKVIVLGGSGMLGAMLVDYLSRTPALKVTATVRTELLLAKCRKRLPEVNWLLFDAGTPDLPRALKVVEGNDWLINAIGITKPLIHDDNAFEVERALRINALLPYQMARQAQVTGTSILQIATDCVYSGDRGEYLENDEHDARDVYGKTKSLGEVPSPHVHHLRASIIGPEPKEHKFLLDWFLNQPQKAGVNGFMNHRWNGVTTLHFAKLCQGIITSKIAMPHLHHIVPRGDISKYELLQCMAQYFHREDVSITPVDADKIIDRTLRTTKQKMNGELWTASGYDQPPSVPEMVAELASYDFRLTGI